jgi:hypothetical protein
LLLERGAGALELLRGDIIVLDDESKKNLEAGSMTGVNDRTNREGEFPADIVYIIPCTSKPESKVLVKPTIFSCIIKLYLILARSCFTCHETCC